MSYRFNVKINGEQFCTPGLPNEGELTATVRLSKLEGKRQTCTLELSGYGDYVPELNQLETVYWSNPYIHCNDVVQIKLLSDGEYDPPISQIERSPCFDVTLGEMSPVIQGWANIREFNHGPFTQSSTTFFTLESQPTTDQIAIYKEFESRMDILWPSMSESLVRCHKRIDSGEQLVSEIEPTIAIDISDDATEIACHFQFANDDYYQSYSLVLRDWIVVEITSSNR